MIFCKKKIGIFIVFNRNLVESFELKTFFQLFFKTPNIETFRLKWLRIKGGGEFTSVHSDFYRFEELQKDLHIAWIPLSN